MLVPGQVPTFGIDRRPIATSGAAVFATGFAKSAAVQATAAPFGFPVRSPLD